MIHIYYSHDETITAPHVEKTNAEVDRESSVSDQAKIIFVC